MTDIIDALLSSLLSLFALFRKKVNFEIRPGGAFQRVQTLAFPKARLFLTPHFAFLGSFFRFYSMELSRSRCLFLHLLVPLEYKEYNRRYENQFLAK